MSCVVTGDRRHSADLPQGVLEIPCKILYKANEKEVKKLKGCFKMCLCKFCYVINYNCQVFRGVCSVSQKGVTGHMAVM